MTTQPPAPPPLTTPEEAKKKGGDITVVLIAPALFGAGAVGAWLLVGELSTANTGLLLGIAAGLVLGTPLVSLALLGRFRAAPTQEAAWRNAPPPPPQPQIIVLRPDMFGKPPPYIPPPPLEMLESGAPSNHLRLVGDADDGWL
jgi:hypothetical protein